MQSGVVALWRTNFAQTLVPAEMAPLVATNGTRSDRSQLTVEVGVAKGLADDPETFQASQNAPEPLLRFHAAQNEMRVAV